MRECSNPTCVTCHVSGVRCQVSDFSCCDSHFLDLFVSDKVVELVGGGSVINGAYPVKFLGFLTCASVDLTVIPA